MTEIIRKNQNLTSKEISEASGSNFIASFKFMPEEKKSAMHAIYAFCRLTDDIVDLAEDQGTPEEQVRKELEDWRSETIEALEGQFSGGAPAVLREIANAVKTYDIPEKCLTGLIEGCRMDLDKKSYENFDELYQYCYRVASLVGLMCLEVFGYKNKKSKDFAVHLGIGFQLTNILRDIRTDATLGRIYLPEDDLRKFGFSRDQFLSLTRSISPAKQDLDKFKRLMKFQIERAESYYQKALENLTKEDRKNLVAAEIMSSVYSTILKKIKSHPEKVLAKKMRLSKARAASLALKSWTANRLNL